MVPLQPLLIPVLSQVNFDQDDAAICAVDDFDLIRVGCHVKEFTDHRDEEVLIHGDLGPFAHRWHYWSVVSRVT